VNLRVTQGESHARIRYAKALRAGLMRSKRDRLEPLVIGLKNVCFPISAIVDTRKNRTR